MNSNDYENKKIGKFEGILIALALLSAIISFFYERFFPTVFIIFVIIFLRRSIKSIKNQDYTNFYLNIIITFIFIIGIFLVI